MTSIFLCLCFFFVGRGEIRQIDPSTGKVTNRKYKKKTKYGPACDEKRQDAILEIVTNIIYKKMEKAGLKRYYLNRGWPSTFVYATRRNFTNSKKLMIIIHGSGKVRAGQWSRRLILYHSLGKGSQMKYIDDARKYGYDLLVMNTNDNVRYNRSGQPVFIPGSETPERHAISVWDRFVAPSRNIGKVVVMAHSYGGVVTLTLARYRPQQFFRLVKRVAFTDSVHSFLRPRENYPLLPYFYPVG